MVGAPFQGDRKYNENMAHLIEIRDMYKIYAIGDEPVHALDGVSLSVDDGEFVAIMNGLVRLRQVDDAKHPRLPRRSDKGLVSP